MENIITKWDNLVATYTAQKMEFSIKDFFSKCDQIRSILRIWSHLLKKSLMENFIFCAVIMRHQVPELMQQILAEVLEIADSVELRYF